MFNDFKTVFLKAYGSYAYTHYLLKKRINVFLLGKFIQWMIQTYTDETPVYLGGQTQDDMTTCYNLSRGNFEVCRRLKCEHEEADDRIFSCRPWC